MPNTPRLFAHGVALIPVHEALRHWDGEVELGGLLMACRWTIWRCMASQEAYDETRNGSVENSNGRANSDGYSQPVGEVFQSDNQRESGLKSRLI
jgi:hypothetical protein